MGVTTAGLYAAMGPYGEGRPRGKGRQFGEDEGGRPGRGEHRRRRRPGPGIHALLMVALRAPAAREDTETQGLVDKVIADRKAMIAAESTRLTAFEGLVTAVRSGDEEAIAEAKEDLKDATNVVRAKAEKLHEHLKALKERLDELGVLDKLKQRRRENGEGRRGQDQGFRGRRRGKGRDKAEDAPLDID